MKAHGHESGRHEAGIPIRWAHIYALAWCDGDRPSVDLHSSQREPTAEKRCVYHRSVTLQGRRALSAGIIRQERAGWDQDGGPAAARRRGEGLTPTRFVTRIEIFLTILPLSIDAHRTFYSKQHAINPLPESWSPAFPPALWPYILMPFRPLSDPQRWQHSMGTSYVWR